MQVKLALALAEARRRLGIPSRLGLTAEMARPFLTGAGTASGSEGGEPWGAARQKTHEGREKRREKREGRTAQRKERQEKREER